ncbi:MAG: winged helix-turn-helix domain-containing protein [Candidatus Poribacteria bacterium]|nr:winged helix-turn-helix domain-containing protein [Candidatus Poribacteria bacterium]
MQGTGAGVAPKQLKILDLIIDLDKHQVFNRELEVNLTATEFRLLTLFASAPGRVFTRDLLMNELWAITITRWIAPWIFTSVDRGASCIN